MVAVVTQMDSLVVTPRWPITSSEPSSAMALTFSKLGHITGSLCASRAKGTGLYQSAAALISLGNVQVDFETEWNDFLNNHRKFERKLWLKDAESGAGLGSKGQD